MPPRKTDEWKIPGAIAGVIVATLIGILSWFLNNSYTQQQTINKLFFTYKKERDIQIIDIERRMALMEYKIQSRR